MLRRLFTLLSAASLLLCVGVCVLWVRSYWHTTYARYEAAVTEESVGRSYYGTLEGGSVLLARQVETLGSTYRQPADWTAFDQPTEYYHPALHTVEPNFLGVRYHATDRHLSLTLPCWVFAVASAVLPTITISRASRRRGRARAGL